MREPEEVKDERTYHAPDQKGSQGEPVEPASRARQGVGSGRVVMVLAIGLALVILAFAATYVGAV